ncbi:MAG TPA: hypothetical protein VN950_03230 [Terriglobales bacterium]|nr:hypothetical protein [Terriglobales bacterium]
MNGRVAPSGIYRHYYNWFLWKVLAPYGLLIVIWFAYSMRRDVNSPFTSAFAHGELLVFAAVLLIEVSFEGEELRWAQENPFSVWFDGVLPFLKFIALFVICLFGFFRYDVVTLSGQTGSNSDPYAEGRLLAYAVFNLAVASTAVVVAIFACIKHCEHELRSRLAMLTT